jgi:polysaccharide biosynthesis protein PslG
MKMAFRALLVSIAPLFSSAQELPEPTIPNGVGVNIHFVTGHKEDLDLIQSAGFKFVRMDFGWAGIETQKGQYRWSEYEQLLDNLDQRGIRAVLILDYSNPLYESQVTSTNPLTHELHQTIASPQHPESVAAYAAWAAAAAKHFHGRHVLWELWNEPNIDFWSPKPNVRQYTTMALAAAKAIREANPSATIIGPATSGFPWEFLETFLQSGVLRYLDGVSVHPYREPRRAPETAASDYQRLRTVITSHAPSEKRDVPILSGEWGYSSWQRGVPQDTQAAFLVRQQLINLLNQVPLSIWYDWKNDGDDPKENEHNFGTVQSDLKPKPAYSAVKTLTHELLGYRVGHRQTVESDRDFVLVCTNTIGDQKLVAWTTGEPHELKLAVPAGYQVGGISTTGAPLPTPVVDGTCQIPLSASPVYLTIQNGR